jgi:hypothetical protein
VFASSAACVKDRGAVGRWQTVKAMMGIGPLKKGHLKNLGYDATAPATESRHQALEKAVKRYGRCVHRSASSMRLRPTPSARLPLGPKTYKQDMRFVQKFTQSSRRPELSPEDLRRSTCYRKKTILNLRLDR